LSNIAFHFDTIQKTVNFQKNETIKKIHFPRLWIFLEVVMKPFLNPKTKKELIKVIPVIIIFATAMLLITLVGIFSANKSVSPSIASEFLRFYQEMGGSRILGEPVGKPITTRNRQCIQQHTQYALMEKCGNQPPNLVKLGNLASPANPPNENASNIACPLTLYMNTTTCEAFVHYLDTNNLNEFMGEPIGDVYPTDENYLRQNFEYGALLLNLSTVQTTNQVLRVELGKEHYAGEPKISNGSVRTSDQLQIRIQLPAQISSPIEESKLVISVSDMLGNPIPNCIVSGVEVTDSQGTTHIKTDISSQEYAITHSDGVATIPFNFPIIRNQLMTLRVTILWGNESYTQEIQYSDNLLLGNQEP
jgi:hypothetical protein